MINAESAGGAGGAGGAAAGAHGVVWDGPDVCPFVPLLCLNGVVLDECFIGHVHGAHDGRVEGGKVDADDGVLVDASYGRQYDGTLESSFVVCSLWDEEPGYVVATVFEHESDGPNALSSVENVVAVDAADVGHLDGVDNFALCTNEFENEDAVLHAVFGELCAPFWRGEFDWDLIIGQIKFALLEEVFSERV